MSDWVFKKHVVVTYKLEISNMAEEQAVAIADSTPTNQWTQCGEDDNAPYEIEELD